MSPKVAKCSKDLHMSFDQESQHELLDKLNAAYAEELASIRKQASRLRDQALKNKLFAENLERQLKDYLHREYLEQQEY